MTGRFAHIDAMRAVAVLLVVWTHSAESFAAISGSQLFLDEIQKSANFGRVGVVVFFAISGMLIPSSLKSSAGQFLMRRFFRLFPAFWLSVFIYWAILPGHTGADLLANMTMLSWLFGHEPLLGLYWTLETELYFYLVCIVVFWTGTLHQIRALSALAVAFSVIFVVTSALHLVPESVPGPYKGLPLHLAIMFWGATFRKAYDTVDYLSFNFLAATGAVALASTAILGYGILSGDPKQVANGLAYLIGLGLFGLLATVLKITFGPVAWLGRISYSVYLLHGAAMTLVFTYLAGEEPLGLYMIVTAAVTVPLAWASYAIVEIAGMRFSLPFNFGRQAMT